MSMQLSDISVRTQLVLPVVLLATVGASAIWFGLQTEAPPRARVLVLHPALTNTQIETVLGSEDVAVGVGDPAVAMNDPFYRFPEEAETSSAIADPVPKELHLTTIAGGRNGRYCLINGKVFVKGQGGDGFAVQAIGDAEVQVQLKHENFRIIPGQRAGVVGGRLVSVQAAAAALPQKKPGDAVPEAGLPDGVEGAD